MKEKEIILKRKVVFEQSSEELWGPYPWMQFLNIEEFKAWQKDKLDLHIYTDSYTDAESKDIPIVIMKALIKKAEDAGANYIQIDYHCDHEEYDIYGSQITRATEDEVEEQKRKERVSEKMKISGAIRGLEAKIKELKKQL